MERGINMYISKITGDSLKRFTPTKNIYELHKLVWSFFPNRSNKKRDFLYYLFNNELYILSKKIPALCPVVLLQRQTKECEIALRNGVYLSYDLRFNAQVTYNNRKMSIMTALAERLKEANKRYSWNDLAYYSSLNWLKKKGRTYGFENMKSNFQVRNFQFCKFRKKPDEKAVSFYTIDINGVLRVTNHNLLEHTFYTGIGRSKAFGCGLILMRLYSPELG